MNGTPICPCDTFQHPSVLFNPPGRDTIAYRVGDYATFRHALMLSRPGETELVNVRPDSAGAPTVQMNWRPGAKGDLAVQMIEWWAYLADILTFYNERIANQDYLRTADLPESVKRLIRILGYRPRPGIGAAGFLAALMIGPKPFSLLRGFQVQSKPGPGQQPQIFELDADTLIQYPDAVAADPDPDPALLSADGQSVLLGGSVTSIKAGDRLLLLRKSWVGTDKKYALASVKGISPEKDPRGHTNTRVTFTGPVDLSGAMAANYRLLKSSQSVPLWSFTDSTVIKNNSTADFQSVTRQIKVEDPVLFEAPGTNLKPTLVSVTKYAEVVWYANADPSDPAKPPDPTKGPPVPIPHTHIEFTPDLKGNWNGSKASVLVRYSWQDVGQLISTPAAILDGASSTLTAIPPSTFPLGKHPVLIEDASGAGEAATGTASAGTKPTALDLTDLPIPSLKLAPPLRVLFNLLPVSRGKTVANEILGNGDATAVGQEFVLQKSPLTYLLSGDSTSGASYKSTLRVWVNGVEWKEAFSFYGQPADAHIFVTREDEENRTHIQFGDGVNGARLSSGANNIVATYRYGSGADAPGPGSVTVLLQPQPNLKAIRNPVAVGGGADPDPPQQIRRYAPQSVLTFGRAVSGDDYETVAAQAPGVARARAYWAWDPDEQRTLVTIYVGDDSNAVKAARVALAGAGDPNRPVAIKPAMTVPIALNLTLVIDPAHIPARVLAAATAALVDPDTGLFGLKTIRIGQRVYESRIYEACLSAPGGLAVHGLQFSADRGSGFQVEPGPQFDPGEGRFFQLFPAHLTISPEVA